MSGTLAPALAALLVALNAALLVLVLWLLRELRGRAGPGARDLESALGRLLGEQETRLERSLRQEIAHTARVNRQEQAQALAVFQDTLLRQGGETTRTQNAQLDSFAQQLAHLRSSLSESLAGQMLTLRDSNEQRLHELRQTLEQQLAQLQAGNAAKLEEMRQTVDEKLHATLEQRLGQSFKHVAERLEQVHKGLGEMHVLAQGVGDLKHLLANVKTRGMFGEAQLGALLEQVFAPDHYAAQVTTRPGSRNAVDFAIRLPGRGDDDTPLWLPIDAKFPTGDYERLLEAQQRADAVAVEAAARALEARVRHEARSIAEKYVEPPYTTDFAILFLPSEGLYAEVLRRPGLVPALQREYRVTLAGPTTLLAMLNSLHMGFRTLALEKRSSEVWEVLGAVKTEFGKFGTVLARVKAQTQTVLNTLDKAQTRTRVMDRALRDVQALPGADAQAVLPEAAQAAPEQDEEDPGSR
ncbi:MAG: DNA recombination protein RmuC [Ottowia sp.]